MTPDPRAAAISELGRVAAEMNQVAREWARVTPDDPAGPELLRQWRARIALSLASIGGQGGQARARR